MISKELLLSILSMDAYNRGYNAGISDTEDDDPDGLGEGGSQITALTVLDIDLPEGSQAAGFYAIAYQVTAENGVAGFEQGDVIISYRGTDSAGDLGINSPFNSAIAIEHGMHVSHN